MADLRGLIHRMADELDHYRQLLTDDRSERHALATEARAALAQPEPKPLTVQEINDLPGHRENCIYESGSDEILLDGHFTRAQLRQLADSIPTSRSENVLDG